MTAARQEDAGETAGGTGEDEEALWLQCRGADGAAREALVARYLPYAKAVAAKLYSRRPHDDVEFDDYHQLAIVGLMESIDRYSPDRGTRFTTFAMSRIRGAVLSGLERLTERRQQAAFRRRVLKERLETFSGAASQPDPMTGLLDQLEEIGVGMALGLIMEGTGMVVGTDHSLPGDAYAQVELQSVRQRLWDRVKHLTEREREVVQRHYGDGERFEAVARSMEVTKGRVSQLHRQAVNRLRALMHSEDECDVTY